MKNYTSIRKKLSKIIVITIYFATLCYILGQSQTIANWSYTFHEILFLPLTIAYFLIPLLSIIWIYFAIRSIKEKKRKIINKRRLYYKNIVILLSIILIFAYFTYESHSIVTSGLFTIEDKICDNDNYFIVVDGVSVKCTKNEYNLIKENNEYLLTYNWNEYFPNKGKIESIKLSK